MFENITALAPQGEEFVPEAVNEGVWITAGHMTAIEAALAGNATAAATAADSLTRANEAAAAAEASLATANDTIATRDARITALEAENAQLKAGPAGEMKGTVATADKTPEAANLSAKDKYRTSYDDYAG